MTSEKEIQQLILSIFSDLIHDGADRLSNDGAFLKPRASHMLAVSSDSFVSDVDFKLGWGTLYQAGQRAIRQNLSDLAAMGATPLGFTWALELDSYWHENTEALSCFLKGAASACRNSGLLLLGGDLGARSSGMGCHITILGESAKPRLHRNGARAGDSLWITGQLGESHLGLRLIQNADATKTFSHETEFQEWMHKLPMPHQRYVLRHLEGHDEIQLGHQLVEMASSCIDVSDGFALDLHRLCDASKVGAVVDGEQLQGKLDLRRSGERSALLFGGEDFVLLFTAPANQDKQLLALNQRGHTLSKIGQVTPHESQVVLEHNGKKDVLNADGWDAFLNK